jgi:hypothetical protein
VVPEALRAGADDDHVLRGRVADREQAQQVCTVTGEPDGPNA